MESLIGKTISHYKIQKKLGGGGMGVVYQAEDTKLKRPVALKFLPPDLTRDEDAKKRFIHEAQAASALDHHNICTIHEIDETPDSQIFICMAYYKGDSLKERLKHEPLKVKEVIDIASQVAKGLGRAHQAGMIHRDIKPANIMITEHSEVKIVDFGLAKLSGQTTLTKTGVTPGTVAYMSPEQIKGENVDHRTDIWSFGVMLYEMLTGELPFKSDYHQALIYSILNENVNFEKLSELSVDPSMVSILKKLLSKNPKNRFQSFDEIVSKLSLINESTIQKSKFATFITQIHQNKFIAVTLSLILVLLIIFVLFKIFFPSGISLKTGEYVLVSDLKNFTDESVLDHSLSEALRVSLRQSAYVNILPQERVIAALKLMKLTLDHPIDKNTAIDIAKREGVNLMVESQINQLGTKYLLTSNIINVRSRETLRIKRVEISRIEEILGGVDKLASGIREELGESLRSISKTNLPLEKVTTTSLEALEFYSRGSRMEKQGFFGNAIELKEKAYSVDSLFTMAINDLSYLHRKMGNHEKALYYHQLILPLINQVTEREKYYILMTYFGPSFEMEYDKAYQYARKYTLLYPNDPEGKGYLGHLAMFLGDFKTASIANQRAIELDSTLAGICYSNSGFAYALAGSTQMAHSYLKKSKKLRPDYLGLEGYMAGVKWAEGKLDSVEQILSSIVQRAGHDRMRKAISHAQLAALYYYQGQLQNALNECQNGINSCKELNRPDEEAYFHYLMAEIELAQGNRTPYLNEIEKSILLTGSPFFELYFAGSSYARVGMIKEAERIIRKIKEVNSNDPFFYRRRDSFILSIRGEVALNLKKYEKAKDLFSQILKLQSGDPIYLMAQKKIGLCAAKLGDTTAIDLYHELFQNKGEIFMAYLPTVRNSGLWTRHLWIDSFIELGKFYLTRKDTANALKSLNKASSYWEGCDSNFDKGKELKAFLNNAIFNK